jgi:hypothetical protein
MTSATRITCPECQHGNEPERIYCHNCGARLDRSKVAAEKAAQVQTPTEETKHLKKMLDPGRGRAVRAVAKLLKIVLGAVICALIIVVLSPAEMPPESKNYTFAPMIGMDLTSALSSHRTTPLVYDEAQVNSYLASNLRRKDSPAKQGYFPLERVLVRFDEGMCAISTKRNLFGWPVFGGGSYRVSIENGKIVAVSNGGFLGRLAIPSGLMKLAEPFLQKTWAAFAHEKEAVARLSAIEFHPQSVSLIAAR